MKYKRIIKSNTKGGEVKNRTSEQKPAPLKRPVEFEKWGPHEISGESAAFIVDKRIFEMSLARVGVYNTHWSVLEGVDELGEGITSTYEQARREAEKFARRQFIKVV